MRIWRRLSQILFILGFYVLFLFATYPLSEKIPVNLYLKLDLLLGVTTALSARSIALVGIPALVMIILTVVFGRFFCGWVCPMGSTIDGFDALIGSHKKKTRRLGIQWIKMLILLAMILGAALSVQFAGFLDPIPLYTRTVTTFLYPSFVLFTDGIFGFLMEFPFLEEVAYSVNDFFRGFLLPVQNGSFQASILFGLTFLLILAAGFVQRRFWCQNVCPLGALLGIISKWRVYRRRVDDSCTSCGLCRSHCRMNAIHEDFKTTDNVECINCMDCQKICPVNAITFGFARPVQTKVDFSRRRWLAAGATGLFTLGLMKVGYKKPVRLGQSIRPPGSVEEGEFLDLCIRCGECIRVCSTSGAGLQHALLETGLEGMLTPVLIPTTGYCEYECNMCGKVCPTGAIQPLELAERQSQKMGTAHFDKTRCIPWYYGENCMVCEEHCPLPEKAITFREEDVVTIDGRKAKVLLPYVREDLCIGCGICVNRCPLEGERGIYLTRADETRDSV